MRFPELETKYSNAYNENLGYLRAGGFVIGYVDQVNGEGAQELPVMPTRHELLVLVKYWTEVALDYDFGEAFMLRQYCSSGSRKAAFARRRVARIEELVGAEAVQKAIVSAQDAYKAGMNDLELRGWEVYQHGTEPEREAYREELVARERKWQEVWDNESCTCGHRQENHCRRGTVGCLGRGPNHGEQRSEEHCATESCLCQKFVKAIQTE